MTIANAAIAARTLLLSSIAALVSDFETVSASSRLG
jgi:hypothetical protein